ncbi:proton-conducting membrane transporter [Mesorhizobium sp. GR13]
MTFFYMLLALIVGLLLGWFLWGRQGSEKDNLQRDLESMRGERDRLKADTARLTRELEECGRARADLESQLRNKPAASAPVALLSTSTDSTVSKPATGERPPKLAKAKSPKAPTQKPAAPNSKPANTSKKDNLRRLIGIGPVNEGKLNKHGITTFAQIAAWTAADIKRVEEYLEFDGRIKREKWVQQAKLLAAGKEQEFAKRFPTADSEKNT